MNPELSAFQQRQDEDHLRMLPLFFRIYAGICAFSCLGAFVYIGIGMMISANPAFLGKHGESILGEGFGSFMIVVGFICLILMLGKGILCLLAANWIRDRRNWVGNIVISAIACTTIPFGALLGVWTIMVLNRPSVKSLFPSH